MREQYADASCTSTAFLRCFSLQVHRNHIRKLQMASSPCTDPSPVGLLCIDMETCITPLHTAYMYAAPAPPKDSPFSVQVEGLKASPSLALPLRLSVCEHLKHRAIANQLRLLEWPALDASIPCALAPSSLTLLPRRAQDTHLCAHKVARH